MKNNLLKLLKFIRNLFRTEFHIKFLWGSKGSLATAEERHTKFEQVLGMMADKLAAASHDVM